MMLVEDKLRPNDSKKQDVYVEVQTIEDRYYLRGKHLTSEKGRFNAEFKTFEEASRFLTNATEVDLNKYFLIDSICRERNQ